MQTIILILITRNTINCDVNLNTLNIRVSQFEKFEKYFNILYPDYETIKANC